MLRDKLAAVITPVLVLLNGGFGWVLLLNKAKENDYGLLGVFRDLPPSFTVIPETTWRWGNAISALLIPQRGFLMGLPLAIIVFTQWWLAAYGETEKQESDGRLEKEKRPNRKSKQISEAGKKSVMASSLRRMIAAGIAAGLL